MASTFIYNITHNGGTWYVYQLSNPFNTEFYQRATLSTGTTTNGSTTPPSGILSTDWATADETFNASYPRSFTGLNSGTTYTLYGYVQVASGGWWSAGSFTITTDILIPVTPFSLSTSTSGLNATFYYSVDSNTTYVEIDRSWDSVLSYSHGGGSWSITYQVPNYSTNYSWRIRAGNSQGVSSWSSYQSFRSDDPPRPSDWNWTTTENNAFNNNGLTTTLSYTRWNDFVFRVNDFVYYYNLKYGSSTPNPLSALMTSGDRTLTATRFNTVRFSIGSMFSTGITNRNTGDTVFGSYFITLRNSLNNVY